MCTHMYSLVERESLKLFKRMKIIKKLKVIIKNKLNNKTYYNKKKMMRVKTHFLFLGCSF